MHHFKALHIVPMKTATDDKHLKLVIDAAVSSLGLEQAGIGSGRSRCRVRGITNVGNA